VQKMPEKGKSNLYGDLSANSGSRAIMRDEEA
jgi:hypothetical protein